MRKTIVLYLLALSFSACSESGKPVVDEKEHEIPVQQAQKDSIATFNWESELCTHKSTFDARRYTREELAGTLKLWNIVGGIMLESDGTVFSPDKIPDLVTLQELEAEYKKKKRRLRNLKIVNEPYWQEIKKLMLRELDDEYEMKRISSQAYTNPNVLKGNRFSKVCPDLIDALTSSDTSKLMVAWRKLAEEQSKINGSPEYVMKQFREAYDDPNRIMNARVELITFGWWNKVNGTIRNVQSDEKMSDRFSDLFLETHSECEEP